MLQLIVTYLDRTLRFQQSSQQRLLISELQLESVLQALDTITELTQGPNKKNQKEMEENNFLDLMGYFFSLRPVAREKANSEDHQSSEKPRPQGNSATKKKTEDGKEYEEYHTERDVTVINGSIEMGILISRDSPQE